MAYRAHFDYASTSPLRPSAIDAIHKSDNEMIIDPRRLYDSAIERRYEIEEARVDVASFFDCEPSEIIFCSSSTEALATFAFGVIPSPLHRFSQSGGISSDSFFALTPYDSEAIYDTWLREQVSFDVLGGNEQAILEIESLKIKNWEEVNVISLPYSHPDTGTLLDINEIVRIIRSKNKNAFIHVDARAASGYKRLSFKNLDIDAMTVESCTWGGPLGVATLILKSGHLLSPLIPGTTQERGRRGGIENYSAILGFACVCKEVKSVLEDELKRFSTYREQISNGLIGSGADVLPDAPTATDSSDSGKCSQLPNIISAYFKGVAASVIVAEFNSRGINIHAGSSCGSEEFEPSKALAPVTGSDDISECVFRISWGWSTTDSDVDLLLAALAEISAQYRR